MKNILAILSLTFACSGANASLETCTDLYVGKVRVVSPHGLQRFTLVENPQGPNSSTGGWSQWILTTSPQ